MHLELQIGNYIRLDYCNSLFKNINKDLLYKLQKLQNFAAKVILKKSVVIMSLHV